MEEEDFGKKLIEVRKVKGLTQAEVAEMCKIATRTIQRIETGIVKPRAFTIKLIEVAI
ncbi:helix-turn-helix transcriptional regulator [Algoriphagus sp. C2-6-M1]|uniref:helix-turn-helix domain-containing protein n=1 Tax=Algoriphagus persicinus TaxID=3108754 RepID=UPI002B3CF184|nr:helix-turn-helix transcriptional regulator [Algoriphagus sp. C2-6-M1]MEB2782496.1 helix-turn-helix transcriptional regulator [Algoriphagus sp. C2-6-M1]